MAMVVVGAADRIGLVTVRREDTAWEDVYQTSASSLPSNDDDEWDFTLYRF